MKEYIIEPQKKIPVIGEADLCVVGGSATGLFAAVRAARLGLKVILIEKHNMLGGTAVTGLVNIWHSLHDIFEKEQIIAGLTEEVVQRLVKRDSVKFSPFPNNRHIMNPWELAVIFDELVKENRIEVMLHTSYSSLCRDGNRITSIIVENVEGRGAIKATFFVDASGNGYLARDMEYKMYLGSGIQPPTSCFHLQGNFSGVNIEKIVREHGSEVGLPDDWGWYTSVANEKGVSMRADCHVFNVNCGYAKDLTFAELDGRRQAKAFLDLIRKYGRKDTHYAFTALCSNIGIRETFHYETEFKAGAMDLLLGKRYDNPVMNGSYRIDIHHSEDMGITFRYLDGHEEIFYGKDTTKEVRNWREDMGIKGDVAPYYQIPFEILVGKADNMIAAGRMVNADDDAFGALRVMVNLNQLGEAAGVAAYICCNENKSLHKIKYHSVTEMLRAGGSAI